MTVLEPSVSTVRLMYDSTHAEMGSRNYLKAYHLGYRTAALNKWHKFHPATPNQPELMELFIAAKDLCEAALDEVEDPGGKRRAELKAAAEAAERAFVNVSRWLISEPA